MNIIGELVFNNSVQDFGSSPELNGAYDVATAEINGQTFVYVSGYNDAGIQVLSMDTDGDLTPTSSIAGNSAIGLNGVRSLQVIKVGSETFLAATAVSSYAITMFRIDDDGAGTDGDLVWLDTYRNAPLTGEPTDGLGLLSYPEFSDTFEIGGRHFITVAAYYTNSVAVFEVAANGALTLRSSFTDSDDPDFNLTAASGVQAHQVGTNTYIFVSSASSDNGLSVFRVNSNGVMTNVDNYDFGSNVSLREMVVMDFNGQTYLFVENANASRIQTFSVANSGALTFLSETPNYIDGNYSDLTGLTELVVDGVPFLLVSATSQDTLLVLSLDENDELQVVQTITDTTELDGTSQMTIHHVGSRVFVLVSAFNNDSVAVYEIGGVEDALRGTMADDRMVGGNGDDDILGRGGDDELLGGNGDDVISGHRGADTIMGGAGDDVLVGGQQTDRIEGGAGADLMSGGAGTDFLNYTNSRFAVRIDLQSGSASGGDAAGDIYTGFENVSGTARGDRLLGDSGVNRLLGDDGNDTLNGRDGNDRLEGQNGDDVIFGGNNNDLIYGGSGNDRLVGGHGLDRILGGGGNDVLEGGLFRDRLYGNSGNDTINGGDGDDAMGGGGGRDVFVFDPGMGNDTIGDFNPGVDRIDFSAVNSINNMADLNAAAASFSGDTIIIVDGSNSIFLRNVIEADLSAADFIFT